MRCIAGTKWGNNSEILHYVYKGLIRSVLDYGSEAYDGASNSLKKKLDTIQFQALKIITGGVYLTSLQALQVECGEMPLQLRRNMFIDKYHYYLHASKINHPTKKVLLPCWQYESYSWKMGQGPFVKRLRNSEIGNIEKLTECMTVKPYWHYKKPSISTEIKDFVSKKFSSSIESKNYAVEVIKKKWNYCLRIYTDASKQQEGYTGAAYYIPKLSLSKCFKTSNISIMRAELVAILMALEWIDEYHPIAVVILTDSASALEAIKNMKESSIIAEIYEKLFAINSFGIDVNLEWVPAHCGLPGNERADLLAKQASKKQNTDIIVNQNKSEFVSESDTFYKSMWQSLWDKAENGRHLYSINKDVNNVFKIKGLNRKDERLIHQFRLGKCNLNYYKYLIRKHDTGLCVECQTIETIEHFLLSCPKYERQRRRMYRALKTQNPNLGHLLGNEEYIGKVVAFLKGSGRYNEL